MRFYSKVKVNGTFYFYKKVHLSVRFINHENTYPTKSYVLVRGCFLYSSKVFIVHKFFDHMIRPVNIVVNVQ